jgi:hypothetical protein
MRAPGVGGFAFGIGESTLLAARWRNVARLGRALGVPVPAFCNRRRRRVVIRRVLEAIYPPLDWTMEARRSAAGRASGAG